jgi:hypothetical protein
LNHLTGLPGLFDIPGGDVDLFTSGVKKYFHGEVIVGNDQMRI